MAEKKGIEPVERGTKKPRKAGKNPLFAMLYGKIPLRVARTWHNHTFPPFL